MKEKRLIRSKQLNVRFTPEEYIEIDRRASERNQRPQEFLRDLLQFGMLPEPASRR